MTYYLRTHIGLVRKNNEDSCFATEKHGCLFAVVADGMGGHSGGEVASRIVIDTAVQFLEDSDISDFNTDSIKKLLSDANKCVWERALQDKELQGMGSTATLAIIMGRRALIGHVGDSRAYLFRSGKLEQLTKDHSYVQMLIENGYITKEEALRHPHRNIITRAIGAERDVDTDVLTIDLKKGDVILLCSDGLNNAVTDEHICDILLSDEDAAADRLIEESLSSGGTDNITVFIAKMDGDQL